jgi:hypothetical protein
MKKVIYILLLSLLSSVPLCQTVKTSDGKIITIAGKKRVKTYKSFIGTIKVDNDSTEIFIVKLKVRWDKPEENIFTSFNGSIIDSESKEYVTCWGKLGYQDLSVRQTKSSQQIELPFFIPKGIKIKTLKMGGSIFKL